MAITEVDGQAYDSNKKYPRGAKIKFNLSYKFAEDAKPTANGTKSATYALPAGLNFTNTSGNITCEGYTAGPAGTYTIVDGVVTFIYTKEFLKAHPSDIEGSFSFEGALSESANENKDKVDISFDGPGKTIPIEIKFEGGKVFGGKLYKLNNDGTIDFTIELNVTGKDVTNLVLKDMQGSNLKFADNPEFKLNGTAIDSSKITLGTDDSATLNLGDLKIGKYQLTYKARVEDKTIISGDANKNRAEWSWPDVYC